VWPRNSERLVYRLRRLETAGTVLHVGAHPDDEDNGMLAYLSHGLGIRAVYWSATRGEGGQNRGGGERAEALGILRTWESLLAREIDGGEVLYGPFYDYGFSKSGDDALRRWGRDDLVRELVRAIRLVQPALVVCRWSGSADDGHGHHQAIGQTADEAFDAAADPSRYPDLLDAGLLPWAAHRLYRSLGGDWQPGEDAQFGGLIEEYERAGHVRIDTGQVDPVAGVSYQEQGHRAANRHRSQGMGHLPEPGPYYYYYRLERDRNLTGDTEAGEGLFAGLDPSLTGLADHVPAAAALLQSPLEEAKEHARRAGDSYHPDRPSAAGLAAADGAAILHELRRELARTVDTDATAALLPYLARKAREFDEVAAACLGVRVDCLLDRPRTTPGRPVRVRARVRNAGPDPVHVSAIRLEAPSNWVREPDTEPAGGSDADRIPAQAEWEIRPPDGTTPTVPYWLREPRGPYRYVWPPDGPLAQPLDPAPVSAIADLLVGSRSLTVEVPALYRSAFPGGFRELSLAVLPPMTVRPRERRELVPVPAVPIAIELVAGVRCIDDQGANGVLTLQTPPGWEAHPRSVDLSFSGGAEPRTLAFEVTIPAATPAGTYELVYDLQCEGQSTGFELETTHLPADGATGPVDEANCAAEAFRVRRASVEVCLIDADFVRTLHYGYVEGAQESIVRSLTRFGLEISLLNDEDLAYAKLGSFDAIVIGPNAYNTRRALQQNASRMLGYVADGGTLVVQYQGYGYDRSGLAPYPFRFNQPHDRITDPEAEVEVLDPAHPLMHLPNQLTAADFDGWVHDRGLYFFGEWDPRYHPLLATADRGEESQRGGLLVASYGRGSYAYTGFSLHRQIPAGVPGAIRLVANLLGLAEARVRARAALLRGVELFASLSEDDLYEGARVTSERWVPAGDDLVREGDRGSELFILHEGRIAAIKTSGGRERVVEVVHPGKSLGELAVLAGTPRAATLRAETDSRVLVLPAEALHAWLRREPDLAIRLMERLARLIIDQGPDL
jgi:LmbE family N-acetylglucosaminyl deacetylase